MLTHLEVGISKKPHSFVIFLILVFTVFHEFSESFPIGSGGTCKNQRQIHDSNSFQFWNFLSLDAQIQSLFSIPNQLNKHKPKELSQNQVSAAQEATKMTSIM